MQTFWFKHQILSVACFFLHNGIMFNLLSKSFKMQYWLRIDVSERTVCKMSTLIRIVLRMLLHQCCSLATFPFDRFVSSFKSATISCSYSLSLGLSSSLPSLFFFPLPFVAWCNHSFRYKVITMFTLLQISPDFSLFEVSST